MKFLAVNIALMLSIGSANIALAQSGSGRDSSTTTSSSGMSSDSSMHHSSLRNGVDNVKPFAPASAFRTWSVGVEGGILTPYTFIGGQREFNHDQVDFGYGLYVKRQIVHSFGIQIEGFRGKIKGERPVSGFADFAAENPNNPSNIYGYETTVNWAASLQGNLTLCNISWHHEQCLIQPYVTAGGGVMGFKTAFVTKDATNDKTVGPKNKGVDDQFFIPVGVGLKFGLMPGMNLDLGYSMNFAIDQDRLDGVKGGNSNDKFSYVHLGLEFAIGKRSKPQMATYNPVAAMRREYIAENDSLQIALAKQAADNDRMRREMEAALADDDADGVANKFDKCPGTPADTKVDGSGCPLPQFGDKVTKVYVTDEDKKVVAEAIKNLEFDFGKSTIRSTSFESLNAVATLLTSKGFHLKLAGYTDNVGSAAANKKLSLARAQAIKTYLVSQGVDESKITAQGFGKEHPIASNKTEKGRQRNRRVEFTLS